MDHSKGYELYTSGTYKIKPVNILIYIQFSILCCTCSETEKSKKVIKK